MTASVVNRMVLGTAGNEPATVLASVDPTAVDDASQGYSYGQQWVSTGTGNAFVLVDPTVGAAVWKSMTSGGGGGGAVPTGTGFYHVTSGNMDAAARAVNLASSDVTGTLPVANLPLGTTSSTVAVGNDARITGALQAANNLSDVAAASTARTNLGLSSLATLAPTGNPSDRLGGDGAWFTGPWYWRKLAAYIEDYANVFAQATTGSGAAFTFLTADSTAVGIILSSTGTTSTGSARIGYLSSGNIATVTLGIGVAMYETRAQLTQLSNTTDTFTLRLGFNDNSGGGDGADSVMFRYTDGVNGGRWQAVTRSNSTETLTDTGITADTGWHRFTITVNAAATSVSFAIDGTIVATNTTNIPSGTARATGVGNCILKSLGTTACTYGTDYIVFTYDLTSVR